MRSHKAPMAAFVVLAAACALIMAVGLRSDAFGGWLAHRHPAAGADGPAPRQHTQHRHPEPLQRVRTVRATGAAPATIRPAAHLTSPAAPRGPRLAVVPTGASGAGGADPVSRPAHPGNPPTPVGAAGHLVDAVTTKVPDLPEIDLPHAAALVKLVGHTVGPVTGPVLDDSVQQATGAGQDVVSQVLP